MTDEEVDELIEFMNDYRRQVTKTKEASRRFLVEAGIFTEEGELTENYSDIFSRKR